VHSITILFSALDLYLLASQAQNNGLFKTLTDLLPEAAAAAERELQVDPDQLLDAFGQPRPNGTEIQAKLKNAIRLHDEVLVRI